MLTLLGMGVTLALFGSAAISLRDGRGTSRPELLRSVKRARALSLLGTATFVISSAGAAFLFARANRAYRAEAVRNMESLVEGARDDLRSRRGSDDGGVNESHG